MKKYLFLDFDGVLNHEIFHKYWYDKIQNGSATHKDKPKLCKNSVANLNSLCIDQPNLKIVISSTWRASGIDHCVNHLEQVGFQHTARIIDITPYSEDRIRGVEIHHWLKQNEPKYRSDQPLDYIIFDDDSDMLLWQATRFIQIDPYSGLTPNHVYKANRILNRLT